MILVQIFVLGEQEMQLSPNWIGHRALAFCMLSMPVRVTKSNPYAGEDPLTNISIPFRETIAHFVQHITAPAKHTFTFPRLS